jgi:DNA-binding transcriptional LysR family regulator
LTEAGQLLFEYTKRIFALADEAEEVLNEMHDLKRGRLAVGASTTIGTYLLPELLGHYRIQYPHIELFLDIANANEIQERLLTNRVEIGLIEGAVTHAELFKRIWRQDELVLITSPTASLIAEKHLTLKALHKEKTPFILREQGSGTRTVLEAAIAAQGLQAISPFMELGSTEAIKKVVATGLGVSFVSEHTIQLELAANILKRVSLVDFVLKRPLYLVYLKQKRLSRAAQTFLELLE